MSFPNMSAGTGPAAAVLMGGFLAYIGHPLGIPLIAIGCLLSFFWALRFK